MEKKLTRKQERFCEEYVIDFNGTRAAIAAGYSEKTAAEIASENLTKPNIQNYIDEIQKDLRKLTGVTAVRNILELKKIAYASMAQFKDGWMTEKDFNELTDDQKSCLSEISYQTKTTKDSTDTFVKFKLHDKQRAIEILNKMLGFNEADKLDLSSLGESINTVRPIEVKVIEEKYTHEKRDGEK